MEDFFGLSLEFGDFLVLGNGRILCFFLGKGGGDILSFKSMNTKYL